MSYLIAAGIIALCLVYRYAWLTHRIHTLVEADRLYQSYCLWTEDDPAKKQARRRLEEMAVVLRRFVREGKIEKSRLTYFDSTDRYPYFGSGDVEVLLNFLAPREAIRSQFHILVAQAVDGYRAERKSLLNPLVWLRFVAFLPRMVFVYLKIYEVKTAAVVTLLQILYWLGVPVYLAWRLGLLGKLGI